MKRVYLAIMLPAVLCTFLVCGNPNQTSRLGLRYFPGRFT
jgi:hypothetical protein